MHLARCRFVLYHLSIQFVILGLLNPCFGATFNAKTQFSWVDSSCDSVIDKVNDAGDDFNALVKAAIANLEGGSPSTDLGKGTLLAYFGTQVGQLINAKYGRLQSAFAAQPIALGLYCDGTAFEWVTTYQEGPKQGQDIPGGKWHSKEGRYNPAEGPLYLDGTKTDARTNICQDPTGKNAQGVSTVGGKHIILCPDAFKEPVLGAIPTGEQTIGTSLDTLTSTGAVLLHEATHCVLSTIDTPSGYKVNGVLLTAKLSSNAQKNADTWMYYAMASLAAKNAWVVGLAQALDNFGPKAPKGAPSTRKRDTIPLEIRGPRAEPDTDATTLHDLPGSPNLKGRAATQGTVTVTVTVTKDCPGSSAGGSTSGGTRGVGSTGKGATGTGSTATDLTGTKSASKTRASKGSGSGSTGTGSGASGSTGVKSSGAGHTGTGITGTASTHRGSTGSGSANAGSTRKGSTGTGTGTGTGTHGANPTGSESAGGTKSGSSRSKDQSASTGKGTPNTNTASGFTTVKGGPGSSSDSSGGGGYVGPVPITEQPAQSSANVVGLTTFTGTTTPSPPIVISSSVSSNGHSKETNGVGPFPIFWSHTCWFCPPGLCALCGIQLNLPKGVYPPGSIDPPPGWTGPLPTITIGNDGTPSYDEDKPTETKEQPSKTKESKASSATGASSATKTKSASSSASSATRTSSATSGVNYIFETPAIYSEVSDTIPFSSVSALVASEFSANSINGGADGTATSGTGSATATPKSHSQPASTTFLSASKKASTTPKTTPKPSTTAAFASATSPAFSCSSINNPVDPDYPCSCQQYHYCASAGGGCGWTTVPAAEDCCEDCE